MIDLMLDPENLSDNALAFRKEYTEVHISPMFCIKTGDDAAIAEIHYREWDGKAWVDEFGHPRNDDGRLLDEFGYISDAASPSVDNLDDLDHVDRFNLSELYLTLVNKERSRHGLKPLEVRKTTDLFAGLEESAARAADSVRAYLANGTDWEVGDRATVYAAPVGTAPPEWREWTVVGITEDGVVTLSADTDDAITSDPNMITRTEPVTVTYTLNAVRDRLAILEGMGISLTRGPE